MQHLQHTLGELCCGKRGSAGLRDNSALCTCPLFYHSVVRYGVRCSAFGEVVPYSGAIMCWVYGYIAVGLALWNERKHDRVVRWRVMGFYRVLYMLYHLLQHQ